MNLKTYFITVATILAVCVAVISGVMLAGRFIVPGENIVAENIEEPTGGRVNILMLGTDKEEMRTDTILLGSLDMDNDHLTILSIPRDTRIYVNGNYDKINHMYSEPEKEEATIEAIKNMLDVPINYCVVVNFQVLRDVIDSLGGVEIDVPHVPNEFSAGRRGMYYTDPYQDLYISLPEGLQKLDGDQCEQFLRFRYGYADGDLGRIKQQQYFVKEVINQKLKLQYILKAPEIYASIAKNLRSNYSIGDMTSHLFAIQGMESDDIETIQLPGYGDNAMTKYGILSCFIYDEDETEKLVEDYFSEDPVYAQPSPSPAAEEAVSEGE